MKLIAKHRCLGLLPSLIPNLASISLDPSSTSGEVRIRESSKQVTFVEHQLHVDLHFPVTAGEPNKTFSAIGSVIEDKIVNLADHSSPDEGKTIEMDDDSKFKEKYVYH